MLAEYRDLGAAFLGNPSLVLTDCPEDCRLDFQEILECNNISCLSGLLSAIFSGLEQASMKVRSDLFSLFSTVPMLY